AAVCSFLAYIVAGFVNNPVVPLILGVAAVLAAISLIKYSTKNEKV
ncbi:MAG TPA: sodium:proton antiporter, partial [Lachnospiraceae bacterium]|nr:sodium:proton antiporter [Lachnospiraceae bacterium]